MSMTCNAMGQTNNSSCDIREKYELTTAQTSPRITFSDETKAFAKTRIDVKETPEAHVFKAELPGVKKDEVKMQIGKGKVLEISGERSVEKEEKNDKWHRFERSSGKFLRQFKLPENAKVDQTKATLENGVLTVTVPKEEVKKSSVVVIVPKPVTLTVPREGDKKTTITIDFKFS
ncbi:hypothetical protein L1049_009294 [Liquidambar formosana]|uniref:SHSP domain-containing protein n=1 Tax=Liquidambar formosana TaxID=63359 RepID=A0AAP0SAS3_LIQFO